MSEKLQKQLIELNKKLQEEISQKWNRSLPFYEEILGDQDRWERAKFLGFGEKSSIYQSSYVFGDVKVGKNTWIGPFTILDGSGGLEIGDYCSISSGVQIYTHETVNWALTGGKAKYIHKPVRIGNCCFLGSMSVIIMGVEIGDHSLIGANSFVNKNIPKNSIAFGSPAKVVGKSKIEKDKVELVYFKK